MIGRHADMIGSRIYARSTRRYDRFMTQICIGRHTVMIGSDAYMLGAARIDMIGSTRSI